MLEIPSRIRTLAGRIRILCDRIAWFDAITWKLRGLLCKCVYRGMGSHPLSLSLISFHYKPPLELFLSH